MNFDITPTGPVTPGTQPTPRTPAARESAGGFSRVYQLQEARARRADDIPPMAGDKIPDEVLDEVDRAATLFDSLESQGRRMMFDTDRLSGRVVASLLEPNGNVERVSLADAVDFSRASS